MTDERKLEIAMKFVEHAVRKEGLQLNQNTKRDLGNLAKNLGVSVDELQEFIEPIAEKIFRENFSKRSQWSHDDCC